MMSSRFRRNLAMWLAASLFLFIQGTKGRTSKDPARFAKEVLSAWLMHDDVVPFYEALSKEQIKWADNITLGEFAFYLKHSRSLFPPKEEIISIDTKTVAVDKVKGRAIVALILTAVYEGKKVTGQKPIELIMDKSGQWRFAFTKRDMQIISKVVITDVFMLYERCRRKREAQKALSFLSPRFARKVAGHPPTPARLKEWWEREKRQMETLLKKKFYGMTEGSWVDCIRDNHRGAILWISFWFLGAGDKRSTEIKGRARFVFDKQREIWLIDSIFNPILAKPLFRVSDGRKVEQIVEGLNARKVVDELRAEFHKNGFFIGKAVRLKVLADNSWVLVDKKREFFVLKWDKMLKVYLLGCPPG